VKILVIELFHHPLQDLFDIIKIHHHPAILINRTLNRHFQEVIMSMPVEIVAGTERRPVLFIGPGRIVVAMRRAEFESFRQAYRSHIIRLRSVVA
jgi:hypothetical protein